MAYKLRGGEFMKKIIGTILLLLASIFPGAAFAQQTSFPITTSGTTATGTTITSTGSLNLAYTPFVVPTTGWTRARVNNMTNAQVNQLVCVEAWKGGVKNHLGCQRVNLAPTGTNPMVANWAAEFDAPTSWLTAGQYNLQYNYQAANGAWVPLSTIPSPGPNVVVPNMIGTKTN